MSGFSGPQLYRKFNAIKYYISNSERPSVYTFPGYTTYAFPGIYLSRVYTSRIKYGHSESDGLRRSGADLEDAAFRLISMTCFLPFSTAKSRAVRPFRSTADTNAPPSTKNLVISQYPWANVKVFADFVRSMLGRESERRKTAVELLKHPWLKPQSDRSRQVGKTRGKRSSK